MCIVADGLGSNLYIVVFLTSTLDKIRSIRTRGEKMTIAANEFDGLLGHEIVEPGVSCDDFDARSDFETPASLLIVGEDTDAIREFVEHVCSMGPFDRVVRDLTDFDRFCHQYAIVRNDTNKEKNVAFYFDSLPPTWIRESGIYRDLLRNGTHHGVSLIQRVKNWHDVSEAYVALFDYVACEDDDQADYSSQCSQVGELQNDNAPVVEATHSKDEIDQELDEDVWHTLPNETEEAEQTIVSAQDDPLQSEQSKTWWTWWWSG